MKASARRKPKSRFSRAPVRDKDGDAKAVPPIRLTDQDIELLKALSRHRFLSAEWIGPLIGTTYRYALERINILKSEPNCYIKICDEQERHKKLYYYTPIFYELDSRGITALNDRGVFVPSRKPIKNLTHPVMVDQIMASIELAAKLDGITLIDRSQILANPQTPERTRKLPVPEKIWLNDEYGIRPDGEMFVLKTAGFAFFPGIEADTGSEPIKAEDRERSAINHKYRDYLYILDHNIPSKQFGARTFFIPFITASTRRMQSMMVLLRDMTEHDKKLRKHFLFKTHPLFSSGKPPVTGHIVTEPWARVGTTGQPESFSLLQ